MTTLESAARTTAARTPRVDGPAKVTGAAQYAADIPVRGLLHARLVLSPHAHARLLSVDADEARGVPGVVAVLTAADLPISGGSGSRAFEPLARTEVVFAGQPVAMVVAESEAAAEDGAEAVLVEYEELPAVVDVERAIAPGSPLTRLEGGAAADDMEMHTEVGESSAGEGEAEPVSANVIGRYHHADGDVDGAFASCAAVAQGRFRTQWVHQAYLEPQAAVAWVDPEGRLVVHASTQGHFFVRGLLSHVLGLPTSRIRVFGATLGGAFGAKIGLIEPLVGAAALVLQRPVRLVLTRSEDFAAANPAPSCLMDVRIGATADGTLAALDARIVVDAGAFSEYGGAALASGRIGGPYRWGAWRVGTMGVTTNRFGAGAYRAPSAPQTAFALESLVDELATALGMDPVELRLRNAPERGDRRIDGATWPGIGLRETLEAARAHPLWARRGSLPPGEGVGLAAGLFPGGRQGAGAVCRLETDGSLVVTVGAIDMSGTGTGFAEIAAETFGVPVESVNVLTPDTDSAPPAVLSGGSMVTYSVGPAVAAAAAEARDHLLRAAAAEMEIDPADLEIVDGKVRPVGSPGLGMTIAEIAAKTGGFGARYAPVTGSASALPPELAPSACVNIVHVRVDADTGVVDVLGHVAVQDVGHALNPALCEGQMRGGATQGIGWALYEQLVHDEHGNLVTGSFLNYAIPRSEQVAPIETIIVEVPAPHGPLGAKGIGESAVVPGAGAVANAIKAATGVRMHELPMTAPRVWRALQSR